MTIGREPGADDDFANPTVVGVDGDGSVYILDRTLGELSRFDYRGTFLNHVATRGPGPGQFVAPTIFGIGGAAVWFAERTGHLTVVAPDGTPIRRTYVGVSASELDARAFTIVEQLGDRTLVLASEDESLQQRERPTTTWRYMLADTTGEVIDTVFEYDVKSSSIILDGGRTRIGLPGPSYEPIVLYRFSTRRAVRVQQSTRLNSGRAAVRIDLIDEEGHVIRTGELDFDPTPLPRSVRDSLWHALLNRASFDGRRRVDGRTERFLADVVPWTDHYPPVTAARSGPGSTLWLRLPVRSDNEAEWIVLDSMFNPIARAVLGSNARSFAFRGGGQAWITVVSEEGVPFVARLRFRDENGRAVLDP
jgi:hypothetical protein